MPVYKFNGDTYNIPQEKQQEFEKEFPDASISYMNGADQYDIPVAKREDFLKDFPDAKLYEMQGNIPQKDGVLLPDINQEPNPTLEEPKASRGFKAGVREGWKGLSAGIQNLWGEGANLFTRSSQEDANALYTLDEMLRQGKDVQEEVQDAWTTAGRELRTGAMEFLPGWMIKGWKDKVHNEAERQKILSDIRNVLSETGGDVAKARELLTERAQDYTYGDRQIQAAAERFADINPTEGVGAWIGSNAVQMIPSASALIVAALTKSPAAAKAIGGIGMGTMTAATAGSSMYEARQAGANDYKTWKTGVVDGAIEYITEMLPFDRYTKRLFGKAKSEVTKEFAEAIASKNSPARKELEELLIKANEKLGGRLFSKRNLNDYMSDILAEGASEFSAEALQTMTSMMYEDRENYPTLGEIVGNGLQGALAGVFMGSVLGGASKTMEHVQNRSRRKEQGYVDVAVVDFDGEPEVVEVVAAEGDKAVVLKDGEPVTIDASSIGQGYRFTYEEFEDARMRQLEDEAIESGSVTDGMLQAAEKRTASSKERFEVALNNSGLSEEMKDQLREAANRGESIPTLPEVSEAMNDYISEQQRSNTLAEARTSEIQQKKQAIRDELTNKTGGQFWKNDLSINAEGVPSEENQSVEIGTLADGRKVYILSNVSETGEAAAVTEDGKKLFVTAEMLPEGTQVMSVDDYLAQELESRRAATEQERMTSETASRIEDVKAAALPGTPINLGTEETPMLGQILQQTADGVMVQTEAGVSQLTWEEAANALGVGAATMTDAEIAEAEAAEIGDAEAQWKETQAQTMQQEIIAQAEDAEAIRSMEDSQPLPVKADGSVDQTALWNQSPERWARWNDDQRQDGGANSINYINNALAKAQKDLDQIVKAYNKESDFDARTSLENDIKAKQERVTRLTALQQSYLPEEAIEQAQQATIDAAVQPAKQTMAKAEPQQPVERTVEGEISRLFDMGLDMDEVMANLAARLAKSQKELEKKLKNAPKMGEDAEAYVSKKREHQQQIGILQQEVDFWNNAKIAVDNLKAQETHIPERVSEEGAAVMDPEPKNAVEFAARELGLKEGGIKLQRQSFSEHTGYGPTEMKKFFGLFKSKQDGGMTIEQAGERLMELDRENNTGFFDQSDANAGLNAVLDVLSAVKTIGELRSYITRQRQVEAQREAEAAVSSIMADYEQTFGISMEEAAAYDELMSAEVAQKALTEREYYDYNNKFAEEISDYDTGTKEISGQRDEEIPSDVEGGSQEASGRSSEVLQPAQTVLAGGEEEAVGSEQSEPYAGEVLQQDGASQVQDAAEVEQAVVESSLEGDMPDFTSEIEQARAQVDTDPTEAQKEAGNYRMGHIRLDGFDITIENPMGSVRKGTDSKGNQWENTLNNDYGYIRGTEGVDGDHIDVYLSDNPAEGNIYVIDQINPDTQEFDEHKVMYGFNSAEEAREAYLANFSEGWNGLGVITEVSKEEFKKWVETSHRKTKPFHEYKSVKTSSQPSTTELSDEEATRGAIELFSPTGKEENKKDALRTRVNEWEQKLGVKVKVMESLDDVTNSKAKALIKKGGKVWGWYETGTNQVYIYLPDFASLDTEAGLSEIDKTYIHEIVSHQGLRGLLGQEKYNELCDRLWESLTEEEKKNALAHPGVNGDTRKAADEHIAYYAETVNYEANPSAWDKIVSLVKSILTSIGVEINISENDLASLLRASYQKLATEAQEKTKAESKTEPKAKKTSKTIKAEKAADEKIEDFGEKIGGARKDVARAKIRDSAKLTTKDLVELKDPDKILSRKNIIKYYSEGAMTYEDAVKLLAMNMAVRGRDTIDRGVAMKKYRNLAMAWESGAELVVEITDEDVQDRMNEYSERMRQTPNFEKKTRAGLELFVLKVYNDYKATYEALNYPEVYRNLKSAYIRYGDHDGKYWVVGGPSAYRGWPFPTLEQAVAKIEKVYPVETAAKKPSDSKADGEKSSSIHVTKDKAGYYRIKSRNIPGEIYLSGKLYSKKDAETYLAENLDKLVERENRLLEALLGSNIGMVEREGIDYRKGKDVTPKDFLETFGFRGVEFGNWVPQVERQAYLNKTYDAIMDFCRIVGISPRAFSLGGRLGLAFGSRGKSRALAHYEPLKEVINLTRMKGAGSLAHEWFHALDNYLAKQRSGNTSDMTTDNKPAVRQEVTDAFNAFVSAMNRLAYTRRSNRAGQYWGEVWERAARLFESYIYNELGGQNIVSPLLVKKDTLYVDQGEFSDDAWPYPSAEENEQMKPFFDRLFATLQEQVEEDGSVTLFRAEGADRKQAQLDIINETNPMTDDYHVGIRKVEDIKTFDEVMKTARRESEEGGWPELASYPDIKNSVLEDALKTRRILIYSSHPISNGTFVTPSYMQADEYSGMTGEVYSKEVSVDDIAWINTDEGQYASLDDATDRYDDTPDNDTRFRATEITPEIRDEMAVISATAIVNGTYLKAPNGADTNLTPEQWAMVRTKSFKRWFGDWEKAARIQKLRNSQPIVMNGNEYEGKYELNRDSAKKYILDNLRDEYTILDTGERIKIAKKGGKKVTSYSMGNDAHLKSIAIIPKIIKSGVFITELPAEKDDPHYDSYRYYVCGLDYAGESYTVKMTVGVKHGEFFYDHALTNIEKGKLLDLIESNQAVNREGFTTTGNASDPSSALSAIKDKKLVSILQTNASKVVDENGEPLVVYHGTGSEFFTFRNSSEDNELGAGFYFTDSHNTAERYAKDENLADNQVRIQSRADDIFFDIMGHSSEGLYDNEYVGDYNLAYEQAIYELFSNSHVKSVFLNIRNPYVVSEDKSGVSVYNGAAFAHNYNDGIIDDNFSERHTKLSGVQYVAFKPEQIKSATDNVGLFSAENPDIRFRARGENESAEEFHQSVVDEHLSKYNDIAAMEVFPVDEATANRFGYTLDQLKKLSGLYDSSEDLIAIFAREDETDSVEVEDSIFHESVHKLVDYFDYLKEVGEWMWSVADKYVFFADLKKHIEQEYEENEYTEEMMCSMLGGVMSRGMADELLSGMPERIRKQCEQIFNEIGYDRTRESIARLLGQGDKSAMVSSVASEASGEDEGRRRSEKTELTAEEKRRVNDILPGTFEETEEDVRFRAVGGNSGYVGYSMSKRAAQARSEGRYPKTDFRKEYNMPANTLDALVHFDIIDNSEWHHTSKFGNRTTFYGWIEDSYADIYEQRKKEVNALAKEYKTADKAYKAQINATYQRLIAGEITPQQEFEENNAGEREFFKKLDEIRARIESIFNEDGDSPDGGTRFRSLNAAPTDEVAANGLNLSPARATELAGNIFAALPEESREKITEGLSGNILGLQDAIFQIPTRLAETDNLSEAEIEIAKMIARKLQDVLLADGVQMTRPLTTSEALWMLYKRNNTAEDVLSVARRAVAADNLGFSDSIIGERFSNEDDIRFRAGRQAQADSAARLYNSETRSAWRRLQESWQDMNVSVDGLMRAIEKASGKAIQTFEDVSAALNRLASKNLADKTKFMTEKLQPLWLKVLEICDKFKIKIEDIERYMMLKHGLERNLVLAARDARNFYKDELDKELSRIDKDSSLSKSEKKAEKIKAEAEYNRHVQEIQNGTDIKFQENRKKDYGGLTALFSDYADYGTREDYDTEEEFQAAALAARTPKYKTLAETERAAEAEVKAFENKVGGLGDELWKAVNAATKDTLKHQYNHGMLTKEQYESVRDMFKYYVPLRGFKDNTVEDMYSYYSSSQLGKFSKPLQAAKGRKTEAESPLGWIGSMAESAIQMDNKNDAKLRLYYLAVNRPDNDLLKITETWYEWTGERDADGKKIFEPVYPTFTGHLSGDAMQSRMDAFDSMMEQQAMAGNAFRGKQKLDIKGSVIRMPKTEPEHIVTVKVAGKDYSILINGNPRAAQAINGLLNIDKADDNAIYRGFRAALRLMSSLSTSYNPEFWISNLQRDMMFAFLGTRIRHDAAYTKEFGKNYAKAFKVISMVRKNKAGKLGNSEIENYYREFSENGGITGFTVFVNNAEYDKMLREFAKDQQKSDFAKKLKGGFEAFTDWGEALEQVSRFAAYMTARKAGKGIEESVNEAKEITVNFNRKGSGKAISWEESAQLRNREGKPLNWAERVFFVMASGLSPIGRSMYMFFNASIQGLRTGVKLAKENPKKSAVWAGIFFTMGMLNAVLHALLDDDDDYLDMPDYEKRTNILVGGNGVYFKWALPQEVRPFYAMADIFVNHALGRSPHKNITTELAGVFADLLPVNAVGAEGLEGTVGALMPSYLSPIYELIVNKDFKGSPIYKEMPWIPEDEQKYIPSYTKAYSSTGSLYVNVSEMLNKLSDGTYKKAGKVNINPAAVEHIIEGYGGGTLTTANKVLKSLGMIAGTEEVTVRSMPFLSRLLTINDERYRNAYTTELFYYYQGISNQAKREYNSYTEHKDAENITRLLQSEEWKVHQIFLRYKKMLDYYDKQLKLASTEEEQRMFRQEQDAQRKRVISEISELR